MREIIAETNRLQLCVPTMDDLDGLSALWSDAETMRYIGSGVPWTREQVQERIERAIGFCADKGMTFWTVVEESTDTIIGQGGLVPISFNGDEIELGYRLGKDHWGKGYATEIARASAAYGFDALNLDRLVAVCYEQNLPSRAVLKKVGFRKLGQSDVYYGVHALLHECLPYDLVR